LRARPEFELPADREADLKRAVRVEWASIGALATIVATIYLVMGSSQAMKAAWIEDLLSFVPPIAFLVAARVRNRPPSEEYPYGFHRAVSIAFLAGAVALTIFGGYILFDSVHGLVRREHPTIGLAVVAGQPVWSGWLMIAALVYSGIPPLILGRIKMPLARSLHDKTLKADADMNRADWLTAGAGVAGIFGVSLGWWWADAVAAGIISIDIVHDGLRNLSRVVRDLMDRRPTTVDGDKADEPRRMIEAVAGLAWVRRVDGRLREEGHVFTGELFVEPIDGVLTAERAREAGDAAGSVDWRVHDVVVSLMPPPEDE
jgi:cation diffusion facilitator family transporter